MRINVRHYLEKHLGPLCRLDPYPPERWTFESHGWSPPRKHESLFVFRFCPDIITSEAGDLDDHELHGYLRAIVAYVNLHVINHAVEDLDARTAVVEDALFDLAAGSMELLGRMIGARR